MALSPSHTAAREYAAAGWPVFPITPNGKEPLPQSKGFYDATTDLDQIDKWFAGDDGPVFNIGFCPENAGLCVVDVDPGAAPLELPEGPRARTPRGGSHHFYSGSLPPTQKKIAEHVDTRGRSSYVLLPPSTIDGKPYTWQCEWPFHDFDCPAVPEWIVEKCKPTVEERRIARDYVEDKPEAIRLAELWLKLQDQPVDGSGSDGQCYQVAARLLDFGLSQDTAAEMMDEWSGFDPDWVWEKINNAARYRQNEEGCDAPTSSREAFGGTTATGSYSGMEQSSAPPDAPGSQATERDRFAWHKPTEYRNRPKLTFYDADHMLPHEQRGSVGVIYGASGHHKTNTLLTMLVEVAMLHDLTVLYVAGEGVDGFGRDRVWAHAAANKLTDEWIDEHIAIVEDMPILTDQDDMKDFFAKAPRRPDIVVIDTLATGTPGVDENAKAMSDILSGNGAAGAIRRAWNALVICVSHSGMDETRGIRGHSGQYGNVDFVLHIAKDKNQPDAIKLRCEKMRDGEREGREAFYRVEPIGVPVPVRITEGEWRDLTRTASEGMQSDTERLARYVLMADDIRTWERGLSTEALADRITALAIGPCPGSPGEPGVQRWMDKRKTVGESLRRAVSSLGAKNEKRWAAALCERRLPDGVDHNSPRTERWFIRS